MICDVCQDTGWVELSGVKVKWGVEYSRGSTACKWCEEGGKRYKRLVALKQYPETSFNLADVVRSTDDRPATRSEADAYMAEIRRNLGALQDRFSAAEKPRVGSDPSPTPASREKPVQQPLAGSEPELPPTPDPVSLDPDYSDIPF